ncbi:MAG: hypothetical protein ACRDKW_11425, partial [Actinomycetota bacterium]
MDPFGELRSIRGDGVGRLVVERDERRRCPHVVSVALPQGEPGVLVLRTVGLKEPVDSQHHLSDELRIT